MDEENRVYKARMPVDPYNTIEAIPNHQCEKECIADSQCKSIDYYKYNITQEWHTYGDNMCLLYNITHLETGVEFVRDDMSYRHTDKLCGDGK